MRRPAVATALAALLLVATASLRPVGVAAGSSPVGTWTQIDSLNAGRAFHTATLLPDGRLLVAGGVNPIDNPNGPSTIMSLASSEVLDPKNRTWSATAGPLAQPRAYHTATLLLTGRVLVAGGLQQTPTSSTILASAELFDPSTGHWSAAAPMHVGRYQHTATLLTNGRVLVAGGDPTRSAEVYDPARNTWALTAPMVDARALQVAVLLPTGQVLVAGGYNSSGSLRSAEIFDPLTLKWRAVAPMSSPRRFPAATIVGAGVVLVAGGWSDFINPLSCRPQFLCGTGLATAEVFDPLINTWSPVGTMAQPRAGLSLTRLLDGRVLATGGWNCFRVTDGDCPSPLASAELYDPAAHSWSFGGNLQYERGGHTATLMRTGTVAVVGGALYPRCDPSVSQELCAGGQAEVYLPFVTGQWRASVSNTELGRQQTLLLNGTVLAAGFAGDCNFVGCGTCGVGEGDGIYDPVTNGWRSAGKYVNFGVDEHTLLPDGSVLAVGGDDTNCVRSADAEVYRPATNTWYSTAPMAVGRTTPLAVSLADGRVLVVGGQAAFQPSAEIYDPAKATWRSAGALPYPRDPSFLVRLAGGRVLAGPPNTLAGPSAIYDPEANTWTKVGSLPGPAGHAILLADGRVMAIVAVPGRSSALISRAALYNSATGTWRLAADSPALDYCIDLGSIPGEPFPNATPNAATVMANGRVLLTCSVAATLVYYPFLDHWVPTGTQLLPQESWQATTLKDGRVLSSGQVYTPV